MYASCAVQVTSRAAIKQANNAAARKAAKAAKRAAGESVDKGISAEAYQAAKARKAGGKAFYAQVNA